jgi:hypothetical protein
LLLLNFNKSSENASTFGKIPHNTNLRDRQRI